ncbi:MAG: hypothetical protein KKD18_05550, partial [Nanoarchaeota archaeon]|nr:hypothetical protein [Nanoarchaeota archaeon]
ASTAHEDAQVMVTKSAATSIQILVQNGAKQLPAPTARLAPREHVTSLLSREVTTHLYPVKDTSNNKIVFK